MRTRSERFDELVLDAVERLEKRWAPQLAGVEFAVEEVPPAEALPTWPGEPVPLAHALPRDDSQPPRVVVFRRPLEARTINRTELAALVHEVVVEQVAALLGMDPDDIDPEYDGDE